MDIEQEVRVVVREAPEFALITDAVGEATCVAFIRRVKDTRKKIADFFSPGISKAHQLHKELLSQMARVDSTPKDLETKYSGLLRSYYAAVEANRIAEQRRLDAEAAKLAAAQARKDGDKVTAKAIEKGQIAIASPVAVATPERSSGVSTPKTWVAEISDPQALVKACLKGDAPFAWISFDIQAINQVARSTKGGITIPGLTFREKAGLRI